MTRTISNKEKLIELLEDHHATHGEYPTTLQLQKIYTRFPQHIPSIRWIQTRTGGIINFYQSLGLNYTDARTGARRSGVATNANKKSQSLDVLFSEKLVTTFGESNVHWQAPYNKGSTLHRSDFKVYKNTKDFFFVELFFPQDVASFVGCLNIKIKKLQEVPVEKNADIYFICCNEKEISSYDVDRYVDARKNPLPSNIHILHVHDVDKVLSLS